MGIKIPEEGNLFRSRKGRNNAIRIYFLLLLIIIGAFLLREVNAGEIEPLFLPTATPTRTANSHAFEGETNFQAGNIPQAIQAYQEAARLEPNNSQIWSELARIQTYSSNLLTTDAERKQRLEEAVASADRAVEVNPYDSNAYAIQALAYNWYSNPVYAGDQSDQYLLDAQNAVEKALQLDSRNALALAFRAEIMIDQFRYSEAIQSADAALDSGPELMDVHRVNGYVLESLGNRYGDAINEYKKAAEISPNLTFLYISIGANYRQLKQYELALEYFATAARINEQNKINDPIPYLAIARTYSQMGEFFIAARNVMKAIDFTPANPDVYGQLGIVYFRSRNYEGSIPALQCAVNGCNEEQSCEVRQCNPETDPQVSVEGLPLTTNTVVYYYTYGSVLSAMHRDGSDYCERALDVFDTVRSQFSEDAGVMSIVTAGEEICADNGITR